MITVEHTITFQNLEDFNLIAPEMNSEFTLLYMILEEEAYTNFNLLSSHVTKLDELTLVKTIIWETEEDMNTFVNYANSVHSYDIKYNQYVNYIRSHNGTITKKITVINS